MLRAPLLACLTLALASCSDESGTAGPLGGAGGTAGSGASGGSAGWSANGGSAGSAGAAGSSGACEANLPTLARIGTTFDVPTLLETTPKRNPEVLHDALYDVYLLVTGSSAISGTFLDADGQSISEPFSIADSPAYTQWPRMAYGAGKFLVVWHDNRTDPNKPELRARFVAWNGAAPDLAAPDFSVSGTGQSYQEMGAALDYSKTSSSFLVVWQSRPGDDLRGRLIDPNGALLGKELAITADADWQSGAAVSWSSASDEFLVTYAHAGASGASVMARRVRASDGTLLGDAIELGTAGGTWTTQAAYLPCVDRFFAGWVGDGAAGVLLGPNGTPEGSPFAFPAGYGYPDGFAVARHPRLNTLAAVMHGPTDEDFGIAFLPSGEQSAPLEVTNEPGDQGHFNPRIAASTLRDEWLVVTSRGFETVVAQRLGP